MSCSGLLERLGFDCIEVDHRTIAVGTPFAFADGEPIGFYLVEADDRITISDNADTLMHLAGIGLDLSDRRRWSSLRRITESFGIELTDRGEITAVGSKQTEHALISGYLGAMLAIADYEREVIGISQELSEYITEVEMYLKASKPEEPLLLGPAVQGHSGRTHTFHFDFDGKLIDAARPHGARTGAILRKAADIKNAGYPREIVVVMDDREDTDRAKIETDILSTMVSVLPFTRLVSQSSGNILH
jgi:hypothetical protein